MIDLCGRERSVVDNRDRWVGVDPGGHVDVGAVAGVDELVGGAARPEGGFDVLGGLEHPHRGGRLPRQAAACRPRDDGAPLRLGARPARRRGAAAKASAASRPQRWGNTVMPLLTQIDTAVVNDSTSTTTRHRASGARRGAAVGPHSKRTSASDCPNVSPRPASTIGSPVRPRRPAPSGRADRPSSRGRDRRRSGDLTLFRRALYQLSYPTAEPGTVVPGGGPDGI